MYILFLDSDDKINNKGIEIILKKIEKNLNKDILFITSKIIGKKIIDKNQINLNKKITKPIDAIKNFKKFRATSWNFLLKKSFIIRNQIKFKNISVFEDQVFVSEIFCKAKQIQTINYPVYERRLHEINTLGKKVGLVIVNSCINIIKELIFLVKNNYGVLNEKKLSFIESRLILLLSN